MRGRRELTTYLLAGRLLEALESSFPTPGPQSGRGRAYDASSPFEKPPQLALPAIVRKLITLANALVRGRGTSISKLP